LELISGKPFVHWCDIPAELRNAVRIARNRGLVKADAEGWGETAARFDYYCEALNVDYWLTERGNDELALHRERQADAKNAPEASLAESTPNQTSSEQEPLVPVQYNLPPEAVKLIPGLTNNPSIVIEIAKSQVDAMAMARKTGRDEALKTAKTLQQQAELQPKPAYSPTRKDPHPDQLGTEGPGVLTPQTRRELEARRDALAGPSRQQQPPTHLPQAATLAGLRLARVVCDFFMRVTERSSWDEIYQLFLRLLEDLDRYEPLIMGPVFFDFGGHPVDLGTAWGGPCANAHAAIYRVGAHFVSLFLEQTDQAAATRFMDLVRAVPMPGDPPVARPYFAALPVDPQVLERGYPQAVEKFRLLPFPPLNLIQAEMASELTRAMTNRQAGNTAAVTGLVQAAAPGAPVDPAAGQGLFSAPDLARQLGLPIPRVESCLRRYRDKYPDCYVQIPEDDRRRNEPKYLYRRAEVWPALQALREKPK
jgi:hypothetical protein